MALKNFFPSLSAAFQTFNKNFRGLTEVIKTKTLRGLQRFGSPNFPNSDVHVLPFYPFSLHQLYDIAYNSDVCTTIHVALKREMFRNGIDLLEPKAIPQSMTVSEEEEDVDDTDEVRHKILSFLEKINENGQDLTEVSEELEDDLSVYDGSFMIFIEDYEFEPNGTFKKKTIQEVIRGDPRYMGKVMNNTEDRPGFNDEGVELTACPKHRHTLLEGKHFCPECGCESFRVHFFYEVMGKRGYYFENEVSYASKYRPSKRLGYPPMLTIWQKVTTLQAMDKYIGDLYTGQRPPKSLLFIRTINLDSLRNWWEKALQMVGKNPHHPIMMGVQSTAGDKSGKFVEHIDLMKSLDELQHTEMRNEYRRQIGAVYGVEPIFQGDQSNSGGLNNEGLQITVTNRAIARGQKLFNDKHYKALMRELGYPGWVLALNPSEEADEMAELQRETQSLNNGKLAVEMGLEAEFDDDTGKVIIKAGPLELPTVEGPDFGDPFDDPFADPEVSEEPDVTGEPEMPEVQIQALMKQRRRVPFTSLADTIKKEIEKFLKVFKKRPSETKMREAMARINFKLRGNIKNAADKMFKKIYNKEVIRVEKELGVNFTFDISDKGLLDRLKNQKVLASAYAGIANNLTTKINAVVKEAFIDPAGLTPQLLTERIKKVADVSDAKAELIARTESGKVAAAARRLSYKKEDREDSFKYIHLGPSDNRTTETSKRIKSRTKSGVSWDDYISIVTEESRKDYPTWKVNPDFPVSHFNSRHSFVRRV